ncbi:hypothetical protein EVAR_2316_1 [Eumeta japonica]|uniref:Uncharacterized protein n=1 Tax=Eumeta variegata TaxID=151549 RepID=A0A4C1SI45_EUMVA|nr:hypothetical protein EVAR_2316_1 [Eumeta japonica]
MGGGIISKVFFACEDIAADDNVTVPEYTPGGLSTNPQRGAVGRGGAHAKVTGFRPAFVSRAEVLLTSAGTIRQRAVGINAITVTAQLRYYFRYLPPGNEAINGPDRPFPIDFPE